MLAFGMASLSQTPEIPPGRVSKVNSACPGEFLSIPDDPHGGGMERSLEGNCGGLRLPLAVRGLKVWLLSADIPI
jgi:hypothetical protein